MHTWHEISINGLTNCKQRHSTHRGSKGHNHRPVRAGKDFKWLTIVWLLTINSSHVWTPHSEGVLHWPWRSSTCPESSLIRSMFCSTLVRLYDTSQIICMISVTSMQLKCLRHSTHMNSVTKLHYVAHVIHFGCLAVLRRRSRQSTAKRIYVLLFAYGKHKQLMGNLTSH